MALETGTQVGRYKIVRLIAQGGMAEVYRAEQDLAGGFVRHVALKIIRPEYAESPDFREMFLDEARTACTLSHPNIVHIYEVGESDGVVFMAMELVVGETLATVNRLLRDRGERLSDEAILAVGIYTCSALEAVHALKLAGAGHVNLVHRDVSPHNLLLAPSGALKLIDFGISKAAHNKNLTSPGITKGKAGYFSPEQAMGRALDGRSDLFSLGVTLYKLASGSTPFDEHRTHQARNTALVAGKWLPLHQVCPGLPTGLYHVVDKALAVKADARFANAREMREALEQVALESGVHVGPSSLSGYVEADDDENSLVSSASMAKNPGVAQQGTGARLGAGPTPRTGGFAAYRGRNAAGGSGSGSASTASPPKPPTSGAPSLRHHTERMAPGVTPQRNWKMIAGIGGGAAVLLAVIALVTVILARPKDVEKPITEPVKVEKPVVVEKPLVLPDPTRVEPKVEEKTAVAVVPVKDEPEKKRVVPAEKIRSGKKEVKVAVAEAPVEEAIPDGKGTLRISTDPPDATVIISGANKGTTPINIYGVKSGKYVVDLVTKAGRGSCAVKVMPDRTTKVRYDFQGKRCESDF